MCVLLFDVFNGCFWVKKYIGKGMSNIYYREKLTFSKLVKKYISRKENLKKYTGFEKQKGTRYIRGNVYFDIIVFSCLSSTKSCLRFLLICFIWEINIGNIIYVYIYIYIYIYIFLIYFFRFPYLTSICKVGLCCTLV